jgi:tetratricopeptide (TPR) repeat protein
VDERLEDWMNYQCYLKKGDIDEANKSLQKIIAFKPKIENTVSNFLPANDLVTAWAIEKLQDRGAAANWLNTEIKQYPDDKVLQWVNAVFENKSYQQTTISDAGIRILKELI